MSIIWLIIFTVYFVATVIIPPGDAILGTLGKLRDAGAVSIARIANQSLQDLDFFRYGERYDDVAAPAAIPWKRRVVVLERGSPVEADDRGVESPVVIREDDGSYTMWYKGKTAADNRYVTVNGSDIMPDIHIGRLPAQTSAQGSLAKVFSWYDNEWGFSSRMVDMMQMML